MWIGDVPCELSLLSLPERVLVACFFPAAYIVKLYLKRKGARQWSSQGMQSGLQGNVSTFHISSQKWPSNALTQHDDEDYL
jgi:hypothetical protein